MNKKIRVSVKSAFCLFTLCMFVKPYLGKGDEHSKSGFYCKNVKCQVLLYTLHGE